ncbi:MAG: hypothetical protein ABIW82_00325 [Dokdonella sp.]
MRTRPCLPKSLVPALALMALLFITLPTAHAVNYTVGAAGGGCGYTTIAAAITAAEAQTSGSRPVIYIATNQSYDAQALSISAKSMSLIGGVPNCSTHTPAGNTTITGGNSAAVITLRNMAAGTQIILSHLTITGGHGNSGGGIDYIGSGAMNIDNASINSNQATDGGGIHFGGNGTTAAELYLHSNTFVTNNTANGGSGGGLRADGQANVHIDEDQIWFYNNHADSGSGGGLIVVGPAYAHIGSPGYKITSYIGVMYENRALNGGGIAAISGHGGVAQVDIFATDSNNPVRVEQNRAYSKGGGIYLIPYIQFEPGYSADAAINLGGAQIDDNAAPEGSAVYSDVDSAAGIYTGGDVSLYAGHCAAGLECNSMSNNRAIDSSNNPTAGSTLLVQTNGSLRARELTMRGNEGAHAIRVVDGLSNLGLTLDTCLLAENTVTAELVTTGHAAATISQWTMAGNSIGGSSVMYAETGFTMTNSIITQGSLASLHYLGTGAGRTIDYVMAQETASLSLGGTHLFNADPLFVDAGNGNFRLRADSDAIDVAPAGAAGDTDLEHRPRDVDMSNVPNLDGVRDLGAYERQLPSCNADDSIFCDGFDSN